MSKYRKTLNIVLLCVMAFPSWLWASEEVVNLYSARKKNLINPLLEKFTKRTGIKVSLVTGKADLLLKRLELEGSNTPADLFLTTDAGRLHRAKVAGVLQPISSAQLQQRVPATYRDNEGYWYGLSLRARPILYAKDRVDPKGLSTYEALSDEKWRRKICIRSSDNIYNQSLVASFIAHQGETATKQWAAAFVDNFAQSPRGGDRDQIKAAAAGVCDIAIANTYYLAKMLHGKDSGQKKAAEKMGVFWPNQMDRGAHVNVSGAGVTSHAKNKANAIKLLEFLLSDTAQRWYAEVNYEYPVIPDVAWHPTLEGWGHFKTDSINMPVLGTNNQLAVKIMDYADWR